MALPRPVPFAAALACAAAGCAPEPAAPDRCPDPACAHWERLHFAHGKIPLAGFRAPGAPAGPTYVYIEGDGAAWLSRSRLSADPTPRDPVALRLALNHPGPGALYAARPCQYAPAAALARCDPALWSDARWSGAVVAAMSAALSRWKRSPDERLVLAGWSGGGVIAALLAARRNDVDGVITIAAPLDAAAWTAHHGVSPLAASLDPAAEPADRRAPALHLHGGRDTTVPPSIVEAYRRAAPPNARFVTVPTFGHRRCWAHAWPRLLRAPPPNRPDRDRRRAPAAAAPPSSATAATSSASRFPPSTDRPEAAERCRTRTSPCAPACRSPSSRPAGSAARRSFHRARRCGP